MAQDRRRRRRGGCLKPHTWGQSGWICSTRHNSQGQGMPPRLQPLAPPGKSELTVESPSAPITIPPAACLLQAPASRTPPMQPISAPTYEHSAARTRRKWGERRGGESIVALRSITRRFWRFWVLDRMQGALPSISRHFGTVKLSADTLACAFEALKRNHRAYCVPAQWHQGKD